MILDSLPAPDKRLRLSDSFRFSCHKGLACFGKCCWNRDITLTPYDVLRLKNALQLHSDEILTRYTLYRIDSASGLFNIKICRNTSRRCQ